MSTGYNNNNLLLNQKITRNNTNILILNIELITISYSLHYLIKRVTQNIYDLKTKYY